MDNTGLVQSILAVVFALRIRSAGLSVSRVRRGDTSAITFGWTEAAARTLKLEIVITMIETAIVTGIVTETVTGTEIEIAIGPVMGV